MENKKENKQKSDFIKKLKESYDSGTPNDELIERLNKVNELAEIKAREMEDNPEKKEKLDKEQNERIMKERKKMEEMEISEDETKLLIHYQKIVNDIKMNTEALKSDINTIENNSENYSEVFLNKIKEIKKLFNF